MAIQFDQIDKRMKKAEWKRLNPKVKGEANFLQLK